MVVGLLAVTALLVPAGPAGDVGRADPGVTSTEAASSSATFRDDLDGNEWHTLKVLTENATLEVYRTYTNMTNHWIADALLVYDEAFELPGGLFTTGTVSSGSGPTAIHAKIGSVNVTVGEASEEDEGGDSPSITIGVILHGMPETLYVALWTAGPLVKGAVEVASVREVIGVRDGSEAYAITASDFATEAWAQVQHDRRMVDATPAASYEIPVQNHLLGIGIEPEGGVLTLDDGEEVQLCRCYMAHQEEWVTDRAGFVLSGAVIGEVVVIAADVVFPES